MRQIHKEALNLVVAESFDFPFEIDEGGLYALEITASAKGWWHNLGNFKFSSFYFDDNLLVKLDDMEFFRLNGKKDLFSGETGWNGNKLKGLNKTNLIIANLKLGQHNLHFLAKNNPLLKSIVIYKINNQEIDYILENNPAEDGNLRPWITIILANLGLKNLKIQASAQKFPWPKDSDDLKLIIDGQIFKNPDTLLHRNWFWCGRLLRGATKEFNQDLNLGKKLHYIELWADRMPKIETISLKIDKTGENNSDENKYKTGQIVLHEDITSAENVFLRKDCKNLKTKNNDLIKLNSGDVIEITEELIRGDYIQNRSDVWHKIKYREIEGFVPSYFVEIEGQTREEIIEKIRIQAKKYKIEEDLAIALAGCESRFKPYATSGTGAMGIFQLTGIMREDLQERFNFIINEEESFNVDKNIEAGMIYLKWLFGIYGGTQDENKKVIAAWNAGSSLIPVQGKIDYNKIKKQSKREEAQKLVKNVEANRLKKGWKYIILSSFLLFLMLIFGFVFSAPSQKQRVSASNNPKTGIVYSKSKFRFDKPYPGIEYISVSSSSPEIMQWQTIVKIKMRDKIIEKIYSGLLENVYLSDVSFSGYPQLFIVREEGKYISTSILAYENSTKSLREVKFVDQNLEETDLCCSYVTTIPKNNNNRYDLMVHASDKGFIYEYDFDSGNFLIK